MKLILTGSSISATELSIHLPGLHVLPATEVLSAAKQCARSIAQLSAPVIALAKQAVIAGTLFAHSVKLDLHKVCALTIIEPAESGLDSGFAVERGLYYASFDLQDKKEGIGAFLEKRKPEWTHR